MEQPLLSGEESTSGRMVLGAGDNTVRPVDKLGKLVAVGIAIDVEALVIWSTECGGRSSRPPEAEKETQASRVEAGADMLPEAVVLEAGDDEAMEAGAETKQTSGEEAGWVGHGGEVIPVKESRLCDPSISTAVEKNKSEQFYFCSVSP